MLNIPIIFRAARQIYFHNQRVHYMTDNIQYYSEYRPLPERLSEVQTLFDTIKKARQQFLDDLGAKTLTLSPRDSFELRLRGLEFLYPHIGPCEKDFDDDEDEEYNRYRLISDGLFWLDESYEKKEFCKGRRSVRCRI
jgi:hypothetical protein